MWPFKKATLLSDETARWHVDAACLVLRKFREMGIFQVPRLILPVKGFYPVGQMTGWDLTVAIAEQTKALAGLDDWPFAIVDTLKDDPALLSDPASSEGYVYNAITAWDGTEMLYVKGFAPEQLIAEVIRALATQVVIKMLEGAEIDADEAGARRDLTACMLGFGVFLNNVSLRNQWASAARSRQDDTAMDSSLTISVAELVFDLAVFLSAHDIPMDNALPFLSTSLTGTLTSAMGDMDRYQGQLRAARIGF